MTEEEIIKVLSYQINMKGTDVYTPINYDAIQGLLDLYNKQKRIMKNQEMIIMEQEKEIDKYKKQEFGDLFNGRYISKDKIKDILKKYEKRPLEEGICFYKEIENLLEEQL